MDRYRRVRLRRHRRSPDQRDTPLKAAPGRGAHKRRLLHRKHYEAIPEELEVNEMNEPTDKPNRPVKPSTVPAHCKSVLRLSNPALTENPRHKAASPAIRKKPGHQVSQAGHPTIQLTPIPEAFKGDEMPGKPEEQNLAVTSESITTSNMESDTTFNSDEEEDEDCHSSASSTSSSFSSPEIFRRENDVKEALLDLHRHIKNSTLLDMSHAESLHMHHPPNLSTITDASMILAEKNCEISNHREPESKIQTESFKSDKALKTKTPPKLTNRKPIFVTKKLRFKSPVVAEIFETKHIPASKLTIHNPSEPFQTSSPPVQMKPDAETSRTGEIGNIKEALHLKAILRRPRKSSPGKAKFFDFVNDNERDEFFQKMRERYVKLRSAVCFAKHREPPVP